ncbi:PDDEXK nuclease domain-containing protein [Bacteroides sp.]|uniref:PDDEXK nuclease domain-containing protein n=1 Tax=Bacteroides sp. TaxID=29523 RepID=UPI002582899C|nr:PDDEXK nuclease domain-containing protein [Bacteroides sp.]
MEKKPIIVNSHDVICDTEYSIWVDNLKQSYRNAQANAVLKTNFEKLKWYWNVGGELVTRKAEERWGSGVVEQVSLDLQAEFPNSKGLSADNLWAMKRWYSFYAEKFRDEKLVRCVQELYTSDSQIYNDAIVRFPDSFGLVPWGHHLDIIRLSSTLPEAIFYIKKTIQEGWKRPVLQRYLKSKLFNNQSGAISNFKEQLPIRQAELVQEITKENYDFGFVELPPDYTEHNLEIALEKHISRFLMELGNGFAFLGRQKEIIVDGVSRRMDMLFYHVRLHCYVVVELKAVRFEPEFAGKLNFYVNAVNEILKRDGDNPTIGLLICSDMKQTEVRYSFKGLSTPIGVATYDNVQIAEIEKELPSIELLQQKIKQLESQLSDK